MSKVADDVERAFAVYSGLGRDLIDKAVTTLRRQEKQIAALKEDERGLRRSGGNYWGDMIGEDIER